MRWGEKLNGRNTHYKLRNWTLVAGFVDAGENFEDAVRRKVMEEASIEVKGLRYFGSQTWPFPSNLWLLMRGMKKVGGAYVPDCFMHEQSLYISNGKDSVLLSGCGD